MSGCVTIVPSASSLGRTPAATLQPFIPGVALSKKILDPGLGKIDQLSLIPDTARVPRRLDQWEEDS